MPTSTQRRCQRHGIQGKHPFNFIILIILDIRNQ